MSADSTVDVELGIAATFVCEPIGRWLGVWLDALGGATVRPRLRFAGYQQLQQELRQPVAFRGAPPAHGTTPLPPACQPKALPGRLHRPPLPTHTHHAPPPATHHAPRTSHCLLGAPVCLALLRFADWQRDRERGSPSSAFDARRFQTDLQLLCDGVGARQP